MYRGTTPTFTFSLPIDATTITKLVITFKQTHSRVEFEKTLGDCSVTSNAISCTLTEEETLSLESGYSVKVQLRVGVGQARMASQVFEIAVDQILKDGAL